MSWRYVRSGPTGRPTDGPTLFSERLACPKCGHSFADLEPRQFSFNSPFGTCPSCHGLGTRREANPELVLGDPSISILEGVVLPWGEPSGYLRKVVLPTLARTFKFDLNDAVADAARVGPAARSSTGFREEIQVRRRREPLRRNTRPSGRGSSRTSSAATTRRRATRSGCSSTSSWSRCRARPAAAAGSSRRACRCWWRGGTSARSSSTAGR